MSSSLNKIPARTPLRLFLHDAAFQKAKSHDNSFMSLKAILLFSALAEQLKQKQENTSCTLRGFV